MRRNTARFTAEKSKPRADAPGRHKCTSQPWNLLVARRRRKRSARGRRRWHLARARGTPPHPDHPVTESIASPSLPFPTSGRLSFRSRRIFPGYLPFDVHRYDTQQSVDIIRAYTCAKLSDVKLDAHRVYARTAVISTPLMRIIVTSGNVKYGLNAVQLCVRQNSPACTQSQTAHAGMLWPRLRYIRTHLAKFVMWPKFSFEWHLSDKQAL